MDAARHGLLSAEINLRLSEQAESWIALRGKNITTANCDISIDDFAAVDIRAGVIVAAEPFPQARKPAYRLSVDCGPDIGVRLSSAQITDLYQPEDLVGKVIVAVVNLPPRQIGPVRSEILVLGFHNRQGHVVLAQPDGDIAAGTKLC